MKTEHSYSAKGVLTALGRSALYLLFFVAVQVLLPFVYGIGIAADAAINRGADLAQGAQAVAERLLDGLPALTLLSCLIIADGLRGDHRITEKAPFKESSLKGALRFCD